MKIFKKSLCCLIAVTLSALIIYADILSAFPKEITMYESEAHNGYLGLGVSVGGMPEGVCAISNESTLTPLKCGTYDSTLSAINIPFRKVKVNVTKPQTLTVSGELVGLKIYNKGLIVTNLAPVICNGEEVSPAQNAGLLPGDIIFELNGKIPKTSEDVPPLLTESVILRVKRQNEIKEFNLQPVRDDSDGKLKLGLWVRDSSAGVGTMTYVNPESNSYGALGHGISDSDTGILFNVATGSIEKSHVISVKKGKRGVPGQICGSFSGTDEISGTVEKNCEAGIFGEISPQCNISGKSYPIGVMSQVKTGDATILSTIDGETKEYKIKILRSMPYGATSKGLSIEITDPVLLSKTGGIIQGMSGSPIIQNGKLVGAVTHVLVNDPTRGYGIFIENMLAEQQ